MAQKTTAPGLREMREQGRRIVCLTAYDATYGGIADEAGVDLILVGDSLAGVILGYRTTIPVTMAQMLHHTAATRAGVKKALLVADLPFGSYEGSISSAIANSVELMKAGAEAVKLEGDYPETIAALTKAGIPVLGHLGMTPQSVNVFGGHKIQGTGEEGEEIVIQAKQLDEAGAIGIVLELVPAPLAMKVTNAISCPTIGIGAGAGCSGQIQILHDMLGLGTRHFVHSKAFMNGRAAATAAIASYGQEVREGTFPAAEHSF